MPMAMKKDHRRTRPSRGVTSVHGAQPRNKLIPSQRASYNGTIADNQIGQQPPGLPPSPWSAIDWRWVTSKSASSFQVGLDGVCDRPRFDPIDQQQAGAWRRAAIKTEVPSDACPQKKSL